MGTQYDRDTKYSCFRYKEGIVIAQRDSVVLCGLGGVFVEVMKDVFPGLVPLLATPKAVVAVDARIRIEK